MFTCKHQYYQLANWYFCPDARLPTVPAAFPTIFPLKRVCRNESTKKITINASINATLDLAYVFKKLKPFMF